MGVDFATLGGWVDDQAAVQSTVKTMPFPFFSEAGHHLVSAVRGIQTVLLYKAWKDVYGRYFEYPAQQIGCCVSRGYSEGLDLLQCVQIAIGKKDETFKPISHEAVYGLARVDVGGGRLRGRDGAVGAWAAKAVTEIGNVAQELVGPYSDALAKQWGDRGVPAEIKRHAGEHKAGAASMVLSLNQLDAALQNGYPAPVCSSRGFTMARDANGFCRPSGRWDHAMLICGSRADIPGYCILQSWGMDNPSGPLALDQPPNSFWADKDTVAGMLAAQDTFALSSFHGFPGQKLPDRWLWSSFA